MVHVCATSRTVAAKSANRASATILCVPRSTTLTTPDGSSPGGHASASQRNRQPHRASLHDQFSPLTKDPGIGPENSRFGVCEEGNLVSRRKRKRHYRRPGRMVQVRSKGRVCRTRRSRHDRTAIAIVTTFATVAEALSLLPFLDDDLRNTALAMAAIARAMLHLAKSTQNRRK